MNQNISLAVFGTFGNPHGFKQTIKSEIPGIKTFDIDPRGLQLFKGVEALYALRKELLGGNKIISFVKYSYVIEQGSTRGGTFIGAAVIFKNGLEQGNKILSCLDELHYNLVSNPHNVNEGVLRVKKSDDFQAAIPESYNYLAINPDLITDINFSEQTEKAVYYFPKLDNVGDLFQRGVDLLNLYDTIYFTDSKEVAEYVYKKNLLKIFKEIGHQRDFTNHCQWVETKKREQQESLRKQVQEQKAIREKEHKAGIEELKRQQQEYERKVKNISEDIRKRELEYAHFKREVNEILQVLAGERLEQRDFEKIFEECHRVFSAFSSQKERKSNVETIPQNYSQKNREPNRANRNNRPNQSKSGYFNSNDDQKSDNSNNSGDNVLNVIIVVLFFVLIGAIVVYVMLDKGSETNRTKVANTANINKTPIYENNAPQIPKMLDSYEYLAFGDTNMTIKHIKRAGTSLPIHKVVDIIYEKNPSDIGNHFNGMRKEYAVTLFKENVHLFSIVDNDTTLTNTEGMKIPCFKKN